MVTVTLPDGSSRQVAAGTTVLELARSIGAGLAKATLGARLDGAAEIVDLRRPLDADCSIEIVTANSEAGLEVIRHSASHVMADAICQLWPEARLSIGPATAEGFYYDIDLGHKISDDELGAIEQKMAEIIAADSPFERCAIDREASLQRFRAAGEIYKAELIEGFDPNDEISVYRHGNGAFEDLCRGPHVPSTGYIKAFKLLKVAGAYWRGDETRPMLQRIYGTAFNSKKELQEHLERIEEAKRRDHRKLGKELELFIFDETAPATPFFLPKGAFIYNALVDFMREKYRVYGYDEVITPQILDLELWKRSGHWDKYRDNMYFTHFDKADFGVKPMNCPTHCLIFRSKGRSYRDLPLRIADFGRLHRYERSGVTAGLTRVRSFCQDDGHIFCRDDQIGDEIARVIRLLREVYQTFGFPDVRVYFSTRPEMSVGTDEVWEKAEAGLQRALEDNGLDYTVNPGDGAFYGPKIDFVVLDALRREWQLGTVQLDFNMPARFELHYTNAQDGRSQPVMIHRAILGSLERFIGIAVEHFAGNFPLWLAPVQVRVLNISEAQLDHANRVVERLKAEGYRVETDFGNGRIGGKIREARNSRVPYIAVIGDREVEDGTLNLRRRGGEELGAKTVDEFCALLREEVSSRSML
ncbi:MAG: threonine--tRNA ligase [Planctomycetes bacterium]|nr:threonine--tRNA ligase [Planctomycetota bacterium]